MAVTSVFYTNYRELSVNYHWIISFWVRTRCALKIVALRAKIGSFGGIVLPLLAEWKLVLPVVAKITWSFLDRQTEGGKKQKSAVIEVGSHGTWFISTAIQLNYFTIIFLPFWITIPL